MLEFAKIKKIINKLKKYIFCENFQVLPIITHACFYSVKYIFKKSNS